MKRTLTFSNGLSFPILGLGTYEARGEEAIRVVKDAIDVGYRLVDTAAVYENEKEVGTGIRAKIDDGTVKREDIFVTSKLWCTNTQQGSVVSALKKTLSDLALEYLDLYLIHWPFSFKESGDLFMPRGEDGKLEISNVDYIDTWRQMEECLHLGLTKSIGVSNFNSEQLKRLLDHASVKPVTNQVECHPFLNQKKLLQFCKERDIIITAYSPLANPGKQVGAGKSKLIEHPVLVKIASKYNKTPAQVVLRYLIQIGVNPIPKSANKNRIEENINVFDFTLNEGDMKLLDDLNNNTRTCPFQESTINCRHEEELRNSDSKRHR